MSIRGLKSPMRRPFASVRLHPSTMRSLCIILCIPVVFQPSLRAGEEGAVWGLQLSLPRVPAALYGPFCTTLQPPKRRRGRTAARSAAFPRNPPRGGGGAQPRAAAARRSLGTSSAATLRLSEHPLQQSSVDPWPLTQLTQMTQTFRNFLDFQILHRNMHIPVFLETF